jgi:lipoate-protein ligase A
MLPIRLLNLGIIPFSWTQALYHTLAARLTCEDEDVLILCVPDRPYLCLGYHQVFAEVLDPAECRRRDLPVFRRRLGGGATYLDSHQLFYQIVFHHTRLPFTLKEIYRLTLSPPVAVLRALGLNAELCDLNEIEVDGRRIAGTGGGRIGEACVVVGNILFDFDFETMAAVWQAPTPSFRDLAHKALRERLVTLSQLGLTVSQETVAAMLCDAFAAAFGRPLRADALTADEVRLAAETARTLSSADFLGLHKANGAEGVRSPLKISARAFIHADTVRLDGFQVQGAFWVSQGLIQEARLESEPAADWRSLESRLRGVTFKEWQRHVSVS